MNISLICIWYVCLILSLQFIWNKDVSGTWAKRKTNPSMNESFLAYPVEDRSFISIQLKDLFAIFVSSSNSKQKSFVCPTICQWIRSSLNSWESRCPTDSCGFFSISQQLFILVYLFLRICRSICSPTYPSWHSSHLTENLRLRIYVCKFNRTSCTFCAISRL